MDIFDAILNRRSIRKYYKDHPLEFDKIIAVMEAGAHAPNAGGLQAWKFVVVLEDDIIEEIASYCGGQDWIHTAPCVVALCSDLKTNKDYYGDSGDMYAFQNTASAAENMMLTAYGLGLGSCWVGAFDREQITEILKVPDRYRIEVLITIGYPDEHPLQKEINDLSSFVYFNEFGNKVFDVHTMMGEYSKEWQRQLDLLKKKTSRYNRETQHFFKQMKHKFDKDYKPKLKEFLDKLKKGEDKFRQK